MSTRSHTATIAALALSVTERKALATTLLRSMNSTERAAVATAGAEPAEDNRELMLLERAPRGNSRTNNYPAPE